MEQDFKLTFKEWKALGYHVKKGEHGVKNEDNKVVFTKEQVEQDDKNDNRRNEFY